MGRDMKLLRLFRDTNRHICTIKVDSESCLPKLSPTASIWKRLCRRFRKYLLLSSSHPMTNFHFRSSTAVLYERKRQVATAPVYIIHPFSAFNYIREIVAFFVYLTIFVIGPVIVALSFYERQDEVSWISFVCILLNVQILINMMICFISGYHHAQVKETVLSPKKIAMHYLKGYFVIDFISVIPLHTMLRNLGNTAMVFVLVQHVIFYVRVITMFKYSRLMTNLIKLSDTQHEMIVLIAMSLLVLHWCTCLLFTANYICKLIGDHDASWMVKANITLESADLFQQYLFCFHASLAHMYRLGSGIYTTDSECDYVVFSLVTISGSAFYAYIIVTVLQAIGTANAAETEYGELLRQLAEYLRSKQVPVYMIKRVTQYCEYRFQKRYFRTQSILSTVSEHLRNEITLYTSRNLIAKVEVFKGLPKGLIGSLIACLTLEIYLVNDVIITPDTSTEYWYIISHGTVAMMHMSGAEICHLEDGEVFGTEQLFNHETYPVSIVAIEISEVFRMKKEDFYNNVKNKVIKERLMNIVSHRVDLLQEALARSDPKYQQRQEILFKVRKGTILETGAERRKLLTGDDINFI